MEDLLRKNNLKITKQRLQILNLIDKLDTDSTIRNILDKIEDIDNSTVYRIIDLFLEKGIIEKNINYNDDIYFSIKYDHFHYLKCIECHKKIKIDICPIEKMQNKGFKIISHKLEIDGLCSECNKV